MAGTTSCRTCGQVNAADSEYCVRCGERMPDPSSTQLVGTLGGTPPDYPWEPPAEWDPGELPPTGGNQPLAPTRVGRGSDQVGWNTGHDTGAGTPPPPPWGGPPTTPPSQGKPPGSKKPIFFGLGAVVVIAAIIVGVVLATGGKKKTDTGGGGAGVAGGGGTTTTNTALNGVEKQSATDALTSARVALRGAKSTHLTGTVMSSGSPIQLDLTLAGSASEGTLTINNNDVQLIKIGNSVFIKGDPDFLKQYAGGNDAAVTALNGKWLKTASTSDFDTFSIDGFANQLKGDNGGSTVNPKVTRSTLNGKPVVVLSKSDGSTLSIANTGTPYPLVLTSKGSDGGQLTFSNYNKNVTITEPAAAEVLDIGVLGSYACKPDSGSGGGTLTLTATSTYTLSNGKGGFWGASGDQLAFSGGTIDKYSATVDTDGTLLLKGNATNNDVSFTCTKQ